MTVSEWLEIFDFGYEWSNEPNSEGEIGYSFVDFQAAYLGDIADERYDNPRNMIRRIADGSVYWIDYIDNDLQEEYGYTGDCTLEDEYKFVTDKLGEDSWYARLIYYAIHNEELQEE